MTAANDAPTLTTVTTLTGFTEDTFKEITYADLAAAANEADVDASDTIKFRIEAVSTGSLQKWNGTAWADVVAGTTTLAATEKLQWKAAQDANGNGLNAFTVKAVDTAGAASSTAVQVKADVTASNDAPTITTPSGTLPGANAGVAYSLPTGFTVADVDAGANAVQISFKVTESGSAVGDTLTYTLGTGVTLLGGAPDSNKVYSFQGTLSNLNTWMATAGFLKFTPSAGFTGNASITTSVNDLGNSGGPALSANGTSLTIAVTNDTTVPVITAPAGPFTYKENWSFNQNPFPTIQVNATDNTGVTQYRFSNQAGTSNTGTTIAVYDSSYRQVTYQNITITLDDMADETAPSMDFGGSYVAGDGKTVHLFFDEPVMSTLNNAVNGYGLNRFGVSDGVTAKTISTIAANPSNPNDLILTLSTAVSSTGVIKVQYTDPTANNDYYAAQDVYGNDLATFAQTQIYNGTDTTAPLFQNADTSADGRQVILHYNEALSSSLPALTNFIVSVNGGFNINPSAVSVSGNDVVLNLATAITVGQSVTVKYNDPSAANDTNAVQDVWGNDAVSLTTAQTVNNLVPDITPPTISDAVLGPNGQTLTITFSEVIKDMGWMADYRLENYFGNFFSFTVDSVSRGFSNLPNSGRGDSNQIVVPLAGLEVARTSVVKLIYTDPNPTSFDTYSVHDLWNNELATVTKAVTNNSIL